MRARERDSSQGDSNRSLYVEQYPSLHTQPWIYQIYEKYHRHARVAHPLYFEKLTRMHAIKKWNESKYPDNEKNKRPCEDKSIILP